MGSDANDVSSSSAASVPSAVWHVEDYENEDQYLDGIEARYGIKEAGIPIAYAFRGDRARLIAAAPELLEAVRYLTEWIEEHSVKPREITELHDAYAAIAKATGAA